MRDCYETDLGRTIDLFVGFGRVETPFNLRNKKGVMVSFRGLLVQDASFKM